MNVEFLDTEFEKVSYLVSILTARATNGSCSDQEYVSLDGLAKAQDKVLRCLEHVQVQGKTIAYSGLLILHCFK